MALRAPDFSSLLARFSNGLLVVCAIANFAVVLWVMRGRPAPVQRVVDTVVTNYFFTVTQRVETVSASVDAKSRDFVGFEISVPYHYMMVDGRRLIRFYGRVFSEGSPTSYERIERIYPDRVQIEGGLWLKNTVNPDSSPDFGSHRSPRTEVVKDDGI